MTNPKEKPARSCKPIEDGKKKIRSLENRVMLRQKLSKEERRNAQPPSYRPGCSLGKHCSRKQRMRPTRKPPTITPYS